MFIICIGSSCCQDMVSRAALPGIRVDILVHLMSTNSLFRTKAIPADAVGLFKSLEFSSWIRLANRDPI